MIYNRLKYGVLIICICVANIANSQSESIQITEGADLYRAVSTAVPFLTITPDSRAGAMGDVGAATTADLYSLHWNPAKLAFVNSKRAGSMAYIPWLSKLVPDISLAYLTLFNRVNDNSAVSGALRYFSLGEITFTDSQGEYIKTYSPNEFSVDFGYGMKFSSNFSGGVAMRYIYSDMTGGQNVGEIETQPGQAFAFDIGTYYESDFTDNNQWAVGMNISNIGTKISYTKDEYGDFLPMNLKVGGRYSMKIDEYNQFSIAMDINKLLVPTPPITDGQNNITLGQDDDVSVVSGIFQSFGDAPGGIQEEWRELMYSFGMEYWYNNQFALRGGYFHEHLTKGNRKYVTTGIGLKMTALTIDFAYLITANQTSVSPLEGTMRFTLTFDIAGLASAIFNTDQEVQGSVF